MIGFALFAAPHFNPPVMALAWAVVVGGVLQLGYQLPHLKKNRHVGITSAVAT